MIQTKLTITEAKRQIEELQRHIEALQNQPEIIIKQSIEKAGLICAVYGERILIEKRDDMSNEWLIKVPLPMANTSWTFEAFEWVKTYVTKQHTLDILRCYPSHDPNNKWKYLYITIHL
jgi:hypothetical protein